MTGENICSWGTRDYEIKWRNRFYVKAELIDVKIITYTYSCKTRCRVHTSFFNSICTHVVNYLRNKYSEDLRDKNKIHDARSIFKWICSQIVNIRNSWYIMQEAWISKYSRLGFFNWLSQLCCCPCYKREKKISFFFELKFLGKETFMKNIRIQ